VIMAALRQLTNVGLGCGAAPRLVTARDSPATRVNMARLESGMGGLHVKETSIVERPKRMSVVSNAVSVEAEKELELNIADDVTQVPHSGTMPCYVLNFWGLGLRSSLAWPVLCSIGLRFWFL
jgi:hypothetical protein